MTEKSCPDPAFRDIEENLKEIRFNIAEAAIKSGRNPDDVTLMAVTKTVEPRLINHALDCGVGLIGENRVQELLRKKPELRPCKAHLIGHLQSNKVKQIVGETDMIESVDSVRVAREIGKASLAAGIVTDVLAEVNIAGEESKFGFSPDALPQAICEIAEIPGIRVCGLMSVPPISDDNKQILSFFTNIMQLFIDIRSKNMDNITMHTLSMGMSGDYPLAVAAGSTLVRIGSAVFGERQYR